jgi:glycine hydroxymethyltransferase
MLVDLRPKGVTGKATEAALEHALMTCNKNGVPFDTAPFTVTSGVRLGTAAGTTRGFGEEEFSQIGHWIADVVSSMNGGDVADPGVIASVSDEVRALTRRFPIYG